MLKFIDCIWQSVTLNILSTLGHQSMQKNTIYLFLILLMLLNSCGTKGPLYIPEKQYPQETPAKN